MPSCRWSLGRPSHDTGWEDIKLAMKYGLEQWVVRLRMMNGSLGEKRTKRRDEDVSPARSCRAWQNHAKDREGWGWRDRKWSSETCSLSTEKGKTTRINVFHSKTISPPSYILSTCNTGTKLFYSTLGSLILTATLESFRRSANFKLCCLHRSRSNKWFPGRVEGIVSGMNDPSKSKKPNCQTPNRRRTSLPFNIWAKRLKTKEQRSSTNTGVASLLRISKAWHDRLEILNQWNINGSWEESICVVTFIPNESFDRWSRQGKKGRLDNAKVGASFKPIYI